jgi:hypothetical protein
MGVSWNVLGTGFPTVVPCHDLTLHQPTRSLVAWTHGRSAFRITLQTTVDVADHQETPGTFHLEQNYPNPFNPQTQIRFQISDYGFVSLRVYDMLGKEVATLVDRVLEAGSHSVAFDGGGLASGVYYYQISSGGFTATRKMALVR